MDNIHEEAILDMLTEINSKLDAIQANSKVKEVQPIDQEINGHVSKEEIEAIVKTHATHVGKYVEHTLQVQTEHHKNLHIAINEVKKRISALPAPEKISLESITKLFPKPKRVTICGFEFLRTSVVIFVLILIALFSLILNIKQMGDCRALKTEYNRQSEYIQQMGTAEK
jgi:hypothetical protein